MSKRDLFYFQPQLAVMICADLRARFGNIFFFDEKIPPQWLNFIVYFLRIISSLHVWLDDDRSTTLRGSMESPDPKIGLTD